jgi:hypothetical protein
MMAACDPGSGGAVQYCDGPPDDPTSPGLCVPTTDGLGGVGLNNSESGICLPQCAFAPGGQPSEGCVGEDVCNAYAIASSPAPGNGVPVGLGYCFGGCQKNADCPAGSKCQTDEGTCVILMQAPTKPVGGPCTADDDTTQTCNCAFGPSDAGYCTTFCVVGGDACPAGWVCETYEPTPEFTSPTPGMGGVCAPSCADGGACPDGSKCETAYAAGPDCIPQ